MSSGSVQMAPQGWVAIGFVLGVLSVFVITAGFDAIEHLRGQRKAKEGPRKANGSGSIKVRLDAEPEGELVGQPVLTQSYEGDAGWDLYGIEGVMLMPGEYAEVACGFSVELPTGYWALLHPRSSTVRRGLLVNSSVIDGGYRGPMFVGVTNIGRHGVEISPGERLAQLILLPLVDSDVQQVQELSDSDRGSAGFGSSGR